MSVSASLSRSVREPSYTRVPERLSTTGRIKSRLLVLAVLLGCIVGPIIISLSVLIHKSLRLDESQSLWQSSHTIPGILHVIAIDVHVPLYHILLHFWQLYFGQSIATARLLSLLFFVLTIPFIYLVSRQVLSRNWALFVTVLFSYSPFMNWYANEARMYTLLVFFSTLSQYFFFKILHGRRGGWLGYALTAMFGIYSHYFFIFTLVTHGIYLLATRKQFPRRSLLKFTALGIFLLAELTPWLLYFHSLGAGGTERPLLSRPSTVDFFNAYSQFIFGFQTNHINTIVVSCWPLLMLVAFFAIKRGQKLTPEVGLMASMAFIPVILAFILSFLVTPFFLSRYMVPSLAPLFIVMIWLFSHYRKHLSLAISVVLVAVIVFASIQQNTSEATPVQEDYRGAAAYISAHVQPNDVIALSAPFTIYPFEYYYNGPATIQTLPPWNREATGAIPAFSAKDLPGQVTNLEKNHHYIYLVLSQDQGYEKTIYQYFLTHFKQVSKQTYSPDLTVYVYQVGYYTVPPITTMQ